MKNIIYACVLLVCEILIYSVMALILKIPYEFYLQMICVYFVLMVNAKHYKRRTILVWEEMKKNAQVILLQVTIILICSIGSIEVTSAISIIILSLGMYITSVVVNRAIRIILKDYLGYKTLVVGDGWATQRYLEVAKNNRFTLVNVEGVVSLKNKAELHSSMPIKMDGKRFAKHYGYDELNEVLDNHDIEQIILLVKESKSNKFHDVLEMLTNKNIIIQTLVDNSDLITFATAIQEFDGVLLCNVSNKISTWEKIIKRVIDIFAGLAGCMISLVLYVCIKIAYMKDGDKGPIIFTQDRIGKNGSLFKIYKFRTMIKNAEEVLEELLENNSEIRKEYMLHKKIENDPRITKIGGFLRKTSLDEFPQFWNVLIGEMSLVGPRPVQENEKEDMGIYYEAIVSTKPGITGMWQANGRNEISLEERYKFNYYYYKNWSLTMEFIIVYKTIKAVIYGKGAM